MEVDISKGIHMLVNKKYKLPDNYIPDNLVSIDKKYSIKGSIIDIANKSFIKMCEDALKNDLHILNESAYRSFERQKELYEIEYNKSGDDANKSIALPGHSEHQTGLALDLCTNKEDMYSFENTKEAKWLQEHAHEYGFILRYPKGKENITGYIYEPWHYRYLGDIASKVHESGLTYDEYYELHKKNL